MPWRISASACVRFSIICRSARSTCRSARWNSRRWASRTTTISASWSAIPGGRRPIASRASRRSISTRHSPAWVAKYTDGTLHHIAINVGSIEDAVERLAKLGLAFAGEIIGEPQSEYRQIYTEPEMIDGAPFTTLELVERRWGYTGFLSPASPRGTM
jgi:hypothetical protein